MRYTGIIILLVFCLILLLLTDCKVNTADSEIATEEPETENPQKWSGLTGFSCWYSYIESYGGVWLANGFTEIRGLYDYQDTTNINASKAAVIAGNAAGLKAIWGVHAGSTGITSANWQDFRVAILAAAQWAQDNGVYEFQIGNEEELHVDGTTMTVAQIIINLKNVATDVQEIFTNGNVSYSCSTMYAVENWIPAGKGDIDILAFNVYKGSYRTYTDEWKTKITTIVNAFGVDGTYITEFNLSSNDIDDYSTDEAVQTGGLAEIIEYIKASGIERALFYTWHDNADNSLGVVKADGTYRLLWDQALLNSGP